MQTLKLKTTDLLAFFQELTAAPGEIIKIQAQRAEAEEPQPPERVSPKFIRAMGRTLRRMKPLIDDYNAEIKPNVEALEAMRLENCDKDADGKPITNPDGSFVFPMDFDEPTEVKRIQEENDVQSILDEVREVQVCSIPIDLFPEFVGHWMLSPLRWIVTEEIHDHNELMAEAERLAAKETTTDEA